MITYSFRVCCSVVRSSCGVSLLFVGAMSLFASHAISGASLRRFSRKQLYGHYLPHHLENHAPGLHKWWKAWERTNGRITEHLSPYQQRILLQLYQDPVHKAHHFVRDNWYAIPGIILYSYVTTWTVAKYKQYEKDEWP